MEYEKRLQHYRVLRKRNISGGSLPDGLHIVSTPFPSLACWNKGVRPFCIASIGDNFSCARNAQGQRWIAAGMLHAVRSNSDRKLVSNSFFFVFLLTSVAFLRERSQGTIERVMVSPLTRAELVMGYICGFTLFALVQSLVILLFVVFALRVHYSGNLALVFLVSALLTVGSVNLGIFLSTFAQNEFQVVQFIPLVLGIQVFLSGIFWPVNQLPRLLQPISYILPLTYANDALRGVMLKNNSLQDIAGQLSALLVFALLMVLLSSLTVRRQIA